MAQIPSTPSDGNVKVLLVPTIADQSAPTLAELSAASAVDISCYLTGDGFNPSVDEATVTDERLCSTETFEQPGRSTHSLEVTYIDNTNSPDEDDANAAAEALVKGSKHFVVVRRGIAFDAPFAADQVVETRPVTAGVQQPVAPEANSVLKTTQKLFVTGPTVTAKVVAGA